jgi:ABC-type branched-subunit amino acid transport system ATPase component
MPPELCLSLTNIRAGYNGTTILSDISLKVFKSTIILIKGPNGSGKSSLLKSIIGFLPLTSGEIYLNGVNISKLPVDERVKSGISYLFQEKRIFNRMTVEENLKISFQKNGQSLADKLNYTYENISMIAEKRETIAGNLSGGEQQQLAFGRILMQNPVLILLDEPSAGLTSDKIDWTFNIIKQLTKSGTAVLCVEHRINELTQIASSTYEMKDRKLISI